MTSIEIAIVMSCDQDMSVMREAAMVLDQFGLPYEIEILDMHKNPDRVITYAKTAQSKGIQIIIAGASGAAHLPGVLASITPLPIIGVPIKADYSIDGLDAIYSMLQMPQGVPVATMALNGAQNAALFAIQILGCKHSSYLQLAQAYKSKLKQVAESAAEKLSRLGYERFWDLNAK